MDSRISIFSLCVCTILLSGCAHYSSRPLNRLVTSVPLSSKEKSVSFAYHVFSSGDCKRHLDRNVLSKGYQPVHITLANNTNRCISFSLSNFNFPCVSADEVAKKVHTSTAARATAYGVASLFIWPFAIPAVVDGIGSHNANKKLNADFDRKALRDEVIQPFSSINGLIFVAQEHFHPDFTIRLRDARTNEEFLLSPASPIFIFPQKVMTQPPAKQASPCRCCKSVSSAADYEETSEVTRKFRKKYVNSYARS